MGNYLKRNKNTGEDVSELPSSNGRAYRLVVPNHLLPDDLNPFEHPNRTYSENLIKTTKYSIWSFLPKNLFEQFHRVANLYFLFIVCLNWVPEVNAFAKELAMLPLIFVLGVTAIKDAFEDYRRYKADKKVNKTSCRIYSRHERRYVRTEWERIKVGDFVHLSCNETIPADILLLRSSDDHDICYVETANLDGETNLKQRESVKGMSYDDGSFHPVKFRGQVQCDLPNTQIYKFNGSIIRPTGERVSINKSNILLRECIIRNTDFVEGIVLYAGHDTKALLNNKGTRYKRSQVEKQMNKDVFWCVAILCVMCGFCALGSVIWQSSWDHDQLFIPYNNKCRKEPWCEGFVVFWSYVIIFQVVIPLSLYVSVELIKLGQVYFIQNDIELYDHVSGRSVECRAWNITEDLGQIQYVFCDKTGTLTENKMVFKCCTIGGQHYMHSGERDSDNGAVFHQHGADRQGINSDLEEEVSTLSLLSHNLDKGGNQTADMRHTALVHDFFLLIALCNTVIVSNIHCDQMDDSGYVLPHVAHEVMCSTPPKKTKQVVDILDTSHDSTPRPNSASISVLSTSSLQARYEAESPDELTLVKAACSYGCQLVRRSAHRVTIWLPVEGEVDCEILHTLHFNATRQRMSVIIRHPLTREIILYCKGADVAIFDNLAQRPDDKEYNEMVKETQNKVQSYAESGLRTLCMAKRVLSPDFYEDWLATFTIAEQSTENSEELIQNCAVAIERDLVLIGASGTEDCLQEGVPQTIASLRMAGMKVWMITGDKQETAVNIAHSCKLVTSNQKILNLVAENSAEAGRCIDAHISDIDHEGSPEVALIVGGKTLGHVLTDEAASNKFVKLVGKCTSVVCCRTTPLQKAAVVGVIKDKLSKVTLAVGDGANDVNMIQTANVGIGISGLEGMQAAMASDFSIARFKFLERLLLVHGHWCYDRLAAMIAYNFYKSAVFIFLIFWYQLFNGFSGSVMIDQYYLLLFNVCLTTLPPIIQGVFDQDVKADTLLNYPSLYKQGPACKVYKPYTYWICIADAMWQSLVLFFIPYLTYQGSSVGIWEFGSASVSAVIVACLAHMALEFRSWTWYHLLSLVGSWLLFMTFALVFNALCLTCNKPSDPLWVMETAVSDGKLWFSTILSCVLALMPRVVIQAMLNTIYPSDITITRLNAKTRSSTLERLVEDDEDSPHCINGTNPTA